MKTTAFFKFFCFALVMVLVSAGALPAAENSVRTVKSSDGKDIVIPHNVERVAPLIGAFAQITAMLGDADKMVAGASSLPKMFYQVFPEAVKIRKEGMTAVNIETLIEANAQVVYGPLSFFFNEVQAKQLEAAGIAVVNIDSFTNVEGMKRCVTLIGEVLGGDAVRKAEEFNSYYDGNVNRVLSKTAELNNKPKVMALSFYSGSYTTVNDTDIGAVYMNIAGGVNVAGDFRNNSRGIRITINAEQVMLWNPDIIFTNGSEGVKQILNDKALQGVTAVKNKKVYAVPSGVYLWSVRSAEGALQPLWLAKHTHPELFSDIDMEKETRNFYSRFYRYELSDAELKSILEP